MTISKAHWSTEGDNVRFSMPFSKVDKERRIVSGFATLDNIDKQSDIVTAEASMQAFAKFRGNIREMHQPISVGKMVSFREDKYFDPESKKFYNGVYVSAYVSKGAQDTWEKVLDGTLSGFSIGGKMNKWDDAYNEKTESKVRIIKEYDLIELSLVDNPANQFANILSIQKVDGIDTITGEIAETIVENVFYDKESGLVLLSENDSEVSPVSGEQMQNIGFVEKNDNEKTEMIKFLVDSAKGIDLSKMTQEVSPMTEETQDVAAEEVVAADENTVEVAPEADAIVEKASAEEVTEKNDTVSVEETSEIADDVTVSKSDEVAEVVSELKSTLTSAFSDLSAVVKSLNDEIAELKKSVAHVSAKIEDAESDFNEFGKRIDAVEADTAFRKSGDLGEIVQEQPEKVEKSLWGGRFLKTADLFK